MAYTRDWNGERLAITGIGWRKKVTGRLKMELVDMLKIEIIPDRLSMLRQHAAVEIITIFLDIMK